jgi:hypothetical protein
MVAMRETGGRIDAIEQQPRAPAKASSAVRACYIINIHRMLDEAKVPAGQPGFSVLVAPTT